MGGHIGIGSRRHGKGVDGRDKPDHDGGTIAYPPAMTVPSTFVHASRDLERLLLDVRDEMNRGEPLSRMGEGQG
ncbi:MAG: hypothetical protein LCH80_17860 [Proteobacteria bacterium]|nr:hypothetical protein [Pseudomonadota bacterium]